MHYVYENIYITECDANTYGIGCKPCSENCTNSKCDKFSEIMNCSDGCIAGKTGNDCSLGKNHFS